ncbi:unnamed protein product [Soboliphyme baturini]|uniref:Cyclic nucleotide-binding domain-containing protein n=1 Tax=Soboliphyme baturini TaxID=241478 RepID=A0A183II33_9BILA|nr:unnamed protein product [Soboliphyme baturini]
MHRSCSCSFMYGDQTKHETIKQIYEALNNYRTEQVEVQLYRKNKTILWVLMHISPIRNDRDRVLLLLCQFRDITDTKAPFDDDSTKGLGWILQLARVARRRQLTDIEHRDSKDNTLNFTQMVNFGNEPYPMYKQETPKTPPHIILHYGAFKTIWDWIILAVTFYTAVVVPYYVAFKVHTYESLVALILDTSADFIFVTDVVLNFQTTFVGPGGEIVSDPKIIRQNYFRTWFFMDLLSCLPYDKNGNMFTALKIIRLLRLGRVARKLDSYLDYGVATLLLLLATYVMVAHWLACIWYSIGEYETRKWLIHRTGGKCWLIRLAEEIDTPFNITLTGGPSEGSAYITALYFTMTSLTTIGFGNVAGTTESEKVFCVFMMLISSLLYATIFGHMTTIIQQMTLATQRYREMISSVREFMKLHEVPKPLAERILDYVVSTWAVNKGIDSARVLSYCPRDMKADICVHLNRKVFSEHSCFRLASDGCLRSLAIHFITNHSAPGDFLYHTGESVDALWFVVHGSLEVVQDDEVVAILGNGDVFGDDFWKNDSVGQSVANVRALTYADLHTIKRDPLLDVLNFYPSFAKSFARSLTLTYNLKYRMKFRKIIDVEREKEWVMLKKEELTKIPSDHPVRKLVQQICQKYKYLLSVRFFT